MPGLSSQGFLMDDTTAVVPTDLSDDVLRTLFQSDDEDIAFL